MSIDFTELHVTRIPSVDFIHEVYGTSLMDCSEKAYRYAKALFGDEHFEITHLSLEAEHEVMGADPHIAMYRARFTAIVR